MAIHTQNDEGTSKKMANRLRFSIRALFFLTLCLSILTLVLVLKYREEFSRDTLGAYSSDDSLDQDFVDRLLGLEGHTHNLRIGARSSVESVRLNLLKDFPKLKTVDFNGTKHVQNSVDLTLPGVVDIVYWNCSNYAIRDSIRCFPNVESIEIRNEFGANQAIDEIMDLGAIAEFKQLKSISIKSEQITGEFLRFVPKEKLTTLKIESKLISRDILQLVVPFVKLVELELWNRGSPDLELNLDEDSVLEKLRKTERVRIENFRNINRLGIPNE